MTKKINYFMVNVLGDNGYSFMVTTNDNNLSEEQVAEICLEKDLFDDITDFDYCYVSSMITKCDIEYFKEFTYNID